MSTLVTPSQSVHGNHQPRTSTGPHLHIGCRSLKLFDLTLACAGDSLMSGAIAVRYTLRLCIWTPVAECTCLSYPTVRGLWVLKVTVAADSQVWQHVAGSLVAMKLS
jgi:hypothetical protein